MNNLDRQYQALLQYIINYGTKKQDRTGTGTISVFGRQIRHKMSEGFPLLTTKKMAWKSIVTELLWFLRGDTNIKFLVDNNCHIWDGDAYKAYLSQFKISSAYPMSKEQFIESVKTDDDFANKWGSLGKIYGHGWRNWNGKSDDELYNDYLKKFNSGNAIGEVIVDEKGNNVRIPIPKDKFIEEIKLNSDFAKKFGELGPVYGAQWRHWGSEEILVEKHFGDAYRRYVIEWCKTNKAPEKLAPSKDDFINLIKTDDEFARKWGGLGSIYGYQWRNWDGDAYQSYLKEHSKNPSGTAGLKNGIPFNKSEFIALIQTSNAFAKKWGELGPIYGAQWRNWRNGGGIETSLPHPDGGGGNLYEAANMYIDQITNLIRDLKTNPDSRRLMVNAWNVGELDSMVLPPCHYGFQVYTRELSISERIEIYFKQHPGWAMISEHSFFDKHDIPSRAISLMWNQRSVDTFLGLPFNIASYGLLLEIIAKAVNMVPDELIGNLGDTHLYLNHIEQAEEQIEREPYALPKLNINTEFWPTESGECGVGPIDAIALFDSFKDDNFCKCLLEDDIQLSNYYSHPTIKAPLSN